MFPTQTPVFRSQSRSGLRMPARMRCSLFVSLLLTCLWALSPSSVMAQPTQKFVGERLIELVPGDPGVSPSPNALQTALPECKFQTAEQGMVTYAKSCTLSKPMALVDRKTEPDVNITALTPRCCLGAVMIEQTKLDQEAGLFLFDSVPGVELKELQCPELDPFKFSLVEFRGKPKFAISEFRSSGSAGSTVQTMVFFGVTTASCDFFAEREKLLMQASNNLSKPAVVSAPANGLSAMTPEDFMRCNAYISIFRAESLFAGVAYNEPLLMQQLRAYHAERVRRGVTDEELAPMTSAILSAIQVRAPNPATRLKLVDGLTVSCGQDSKLP